MPRMIVSKTDSNVGAPALASSKQRAKEIRDQIKSLTEELKVLPWDADGFINWNLHRAAKVIQMNLSNITQAVR